VPGNGDRCNQPFHAFDFSIPMQMKSMTCIEKEAQQLLSFEDKYCRVDKDGRQAIVYIIFLD
jgi:hypothetical protein